MTSIKEQYQIGKIMKLIDLNKDVTNFDMGFQVVADDNAEFEIVIIDQDTLDEGNLEYKKVQGSINGSIRNDKNMYQNYMMALRADKPCTINVETTFNRLPDNIPQPEMISNTLPETSEPVKKKSNIPWKYIIIGIIVLIGVGLLYYFYMHGGGGSNNDSVSISDVLPVEHVVPESFNPVVPTTTFDNDTIDIGTSEIFEKLRSLPLR